MSETIFIRKRIERALMDGLGEVFVTVPSTGLNESTPRPDRVCLYFDEGLVVFRGLREIILTEICLDCKGGWGGSGPIEEPDAQADAIAMAEHLENIAAELRSRTAKGRDAPDESHRQSEER